MGKTLGLDLGTNSIGWALVNNDTNELIECGVKIFPHSSDNKRFLARQSRRLNERHVQKTASFYSRKLSKQTNPIIFTLKLCIVLTILLAAINTNNWQFWVNLSLTVFVATLSLLYQDKKK